MQIVANGIVIGYSDSMLFMNQNIEIMKTKLVTTLLSFFLVNAWAQDRTTVNAMNSEISDNLDLRAVASIFGDSRDLEDFEYRLNDPKNQISNLDLNNDNQVDYLRVIESTEGNTHIIVVQSVLGRDLYQDVATVEVEKDRNNRIQVQVVGDVYMYGNNYIYEPVYVHTPVIYNYFWVPNYRPYCSAWYWGYYPTHYYAWTPFPIFRYRSHIGLFINFNHHYNYVSYRRCHNAYTNYWGRRANGYERQYPNRSFTQRHSGVTNRYELDKTRNIRTIGRNNDVAMNTQSSAVRNENAIGTPRGNNNVKSYSAYESPRGNSGVRSHSNSGIRTYTDPTPRGNVKNDTNYESPKGNNGVRSYSDPTPRGNTVYESPKSNSGVRSYSDPTPRANNGIKSTSSYESPRNTSGVRSYSDATPRGNSGVKNNATNETPRAMSGSKSESDSRRNAGGARR